MKLISDSTLSHYGIPGQKWGTRRWQYPDGRFNEEGKIRYFGPPKNNYHKYKGLTDQQKEIFKKVLIAGVIVGIGYYAIHKKGEIYVNDFLKEGTLKNTLSNKINNIINNRRLTEKFDNKNNLYLLNKNETVYESMRNVNPSYNIFNKGSTNNCVLCANNYILRRAGYDAVANLNKHGVIESDNDKIKSLSEILFKNNIVNKYRPNIFNKNYNELFSDENIDKNFKEFSNHLIKNLKEGKTAATFTIRYGKYGIGHKLNAEFIDNQIKIIDSQNGTSRSLDIFYDLNIMNDKGLIIFSDIIDYSNIKNTMLDKTILKNLTI